MVSGKKISRPGVMFYFDIRPSLKRLSLAEKGRLFEAILDFSEHGIEPQMKGAAAVAWDFIRPSIERDAERYSRVVDQRKYAVYAREAKKRGDNVMPFDEWKSTFFNENYHPISDDSERCPTNNFQLSATTTTTNSQSTTIERSVGADKPPRTRFVPPTLEDVKAYCREKGYRVDPVRFIAYYESNGWKVGKNPMKSWRSALVTWENRTGDFGRKEEPVVERKYKPSPYSL